MIFLKINRTKSAQVLLDECIFRVLHDKTSWDKFSYTPQSSEDTVQRFLKLGIFSNFVEEVFTQEFQNDFWEKIHDGYLGYGDYVEELRELFYDYQNKHSKNKV